MNQKMNWKHIVYEDSVPVAVYDDRSVANRFLETGSPGTTIRVSMSLAEKVPDGIPDNPWEAQLREGLGAWRCRYSVREGRVLGGKRIGAMSMPEEEENRIEYDDDTIYVYLWAGDGNAASDQAMLIVAQLPLDELESERAFEDMSRVSNEVPDRQQRSILDRWPFNTWGRN